jgi:3-dehydroquinate dehydratase type I
MKNIIIYWMRWTWKTTVWRELWKRLNKEFIDLDTYIEEKVSEKLFLYIKNNWWEKFRDIEHESLKELLDNKKDSIISLWWWALIFERNQKIILKNNYKLIYIYSDINTIIERINKDEVSWNNRNSLTWKTLEEELKEVYEWRKSIYEKFYDLKVDNNKSLDNCIEDIVRKLKFWNICIPIVDFENDLEDRIKIINNSRQVKYAEIRIDYLDDLNNFEDIISKIDKQIILTNRIEKEWWKFKWNSKESIDILLKYIDKVNYIDFELENWDYINELKDKLNNKSLILSYHDFFKTPHLDDLKKVLESMSKYNPEVYKIALMPNNEKDVEIIEELWYNFKSNFKGDFIFISMWELWQESRVNLPKKWWLLTFWSLWLESAPGQIKYDKLYDLIFN